MQISNKFTIELKDFEKCKLLADVDCPIGTLYDYSCALKSFLAQKIAEVEASEKQKEDEKKSEV